MNSKRFATDGQPSPTAEKQPTLAVWEFAGLLLTYGCNARCAICYTASGPERGGWMDIHTALRLWRSLDQLAAAHGKMMRVHLAGGEPFGNWPRLVEIIRAARAAGLTPVEKVETNAGWATDNALVRTRLAELDALGVGRLVVSTDVHHQRFVPFERVQRCVEIAREVLGPGRVQVRWWDFYHDPVDPRALDAAELEAAYRAAQQRHRDRLTGRAAFEVADLLPLHPPEQFAHEDCTRALLGSRHVHIGPEGIIFPGTCAGIILGQAGDRSVQEIWKLLSEHWHEHPLLAALIAGGSHELMQRVRSLGFVPRPQGYADKCHLCMHVRQWLVDRGRWTDAVGPPDVYMRP